MTHTTTLVDHNKLTIRQYHGRL